MMKKIISLSLAMLLIVSGCASASETIGAKANDTNITKYEDLMEMNLDGYIILGRPTDSEITARITSNINTSVAIVYGTEKNIYSFSTKTYTSNNENPANIVITSLKESQTYYYRLIYSYESDSTEYKSEEHSFETAKKTGEAFSFVVQSDSHLLNKADKELYMKVMNDMTTKNPDFIWDLGDTFLNDEEIDITFEEVNEHYQEQLPYLSTAAQSAPLFLVIGNHEGEYGYFLDGTKDNMSVYAALSRKQYYPNPIPNDFYSGNNNEEEFIGLPENYYAYTWGDALFVALDPYRYTTEVVDEGWDWTLGEEQYKWLQDTLEKSEAKYKFVFAHHAIGNIRGAANIASLYEWGGEDKRGRDLFNQKRPDFEKPIHDLMVDENVTIFFQGHDHLFSRELVDGVIYQTLPKPAEVIPDRQNNYKSFIGDTLINSGYLNITVDVNEVKVDYIRSYVSGSNEEISDFDLAYSYTVNDSGKFEILKTTDDILAIEAYGEDHDKKPDNNRNRTGNGR